MMRHHTKDKGDVGVLKAAADLCAQGFTVLSPMTEHAPFDLAIYKDRLFWRVSVKYASLNKGAVRLELKSNWSDKNGLHKKRLDKEAVDIVCIYCPDSDQCYYVDPREFNYCTHLTRSGCGSRLELRRGSLANGPLHHEAYHTSTA